MSGIEETKKRVRVFFSEKGWEKMEKGFPGEIFKVTYRSQNLITFTLVYWYTYFGSTLLSILRSMSFCLWP